MLGRSIWLAIALVGAVAIPYYLSDEATRGKATSWLQAFTGDSEQESDGYDSLFHRSRPQTASWPLTTQLDTTNLPVGDALATKSEGPHFDALWQVFRFDVSPAWVVGNWSRVTTHLIEQRLEGLRVALVTGTDRHDLAGSLTYYFDERKQVQRISFHGSTGDASDLVSLVTGHFGLQAEPTLGGKLYLAEWNGAPTSVLRLQHGAIVQSNNPLQLIEIDLELNRPGTVQGLSSEFQHFSDVPQQPERRRGLFWNRRQNDSMSTGG